MRSIKNIYAIIKEHYLLGVMLLLSLVELFPVLNNGWVYWDDPAYVLENEHIVMQSFNDFIDMFSLRIVQGNYHPITMISLSIDYAIGGFDPFVFHTSNLIYHLANSVLVYVFTFKLFHNKPIAFFVSLLFAVHPMHLESFAWISERKDVLYVFFFMLGLIQYLSYQKSNKNSTYLACLLLFLLSLLSKGMAVVFPIVLLLLDYLQKRDFSKKVILEKIPFFVLSLVFGLIVIWAQKESSAISGGESHPPLQSILIPIYGLLMYIIRLIVPYNLSALHPYPMMLDGKIPVEIVYSFIPLLLILWLLIKLYRRNRKVVFGFAFFVLVIFPVLQILSVGSAIISERYTYLPYIGLFILLAVILEENYKKGTQFSKNLTLVLTGVYLAVLMFQTHQRVSIWKNDESLWTDVIDSYPEDYFAYMKRGSYRVKNGEQEKALIDFNKAISIFPSDYYTLNNRGMIFFSQKKYDLAEKDFRAAIKSDTSLYEAYLNLGLVYLNTGNHNPALIHFKRAELLAPENELPCLNQALLYERMQSEDLALKAYNKAVELNPSNFQSYRYRGVFYLARGKLNQALIDMERAIQLNERYSEAYYWKAIILAKKGEKKEAQHQLEKAINLGYPISREEYSSFYN